MRLPKALLWFCVLGIIALCGASLWLLRNDAAVILTVGIPSLAGLAGLDTWRNPNGG